jgi:hypothetical protein
MTYGRMLPTLPLPLHGESGKRRYAANGSAEDDPSEDEEHPRAFGPDSRASRLLAALAP